MAHQIVRSVMSTDVTTADPDTDFKDIVAAMQSRRVSALPVVDARGRVLGVVSEADLLRKEAHAGGEEGSARASYGFITGRRARNKARGERAGEVMTAPAVTIRADQSVVDAARLMERRNVKRLPVVDADGRLEGIVSRCDLLRVFLRSDEEIRTEIAEEVLLRALWIDPAIVAVTVDGGRVHLTGTLERKSLIPLVVRLCRAVDGVVGVTHTLRFDYDDTSTRPGRRRPAAAIGERHF
ncbi:MAG TPA: CBS domain-containing protein [Yinghuangia sp.]|uniref:CBS domain-containing protein n=1 Tax=Yinghuangia sp. YIM S10712 TaxID=3436930 RepID=UPI002BDD9885|nr:CBS domain-containing protein [Yinghuangia sp.]